MKTIFNWTAGSFFRSIGRIIAYIFIGCLIGLFINYNNIKIPNIIDYSVESDIKLANNEGFYVGSSTYSLGANGTYYNSPLVNGYWTIPSDVAEGNKTYYFKYNSNKSFNSNADFYYINILFSKSDTYSSTTRTNSWVCEEVTDGYWCGEGNVNSYTTTTEGSFSIALYYTYGDNDYNYIPCNAFGNAGDIFSFQCPVGSTDIRGLRVSININGYSNLHYTLGYSPTSRYTINQSSEMVTQQQETNDILKDDDTSETSSDATDFFNDTTISSGGSLTSIVSSPLYVINNLVTGSSSDLCVTLKSKNICLPSGNIIWGKTQRSGVNWFGSSDDISSGVNAFKAFFNLVVGGYICYKVIIGLILCIDRILTPTHTEIEVMKL